MLEKLAGIAARYDEIERLMSDPAVSSDYTKVAELNKERSQIEPIVQSYQRYVKQMSDLQGAKELLKEADDAEMREMAQMEVDELEASNETLLAEMKAM